MKRTRGTQWMPYCDSYYVLDFCKELARKLRLSNKYQAVKLGCYIKEDNKTYCKIYVSYRPQYIE